MWVHHCLSIGIHVKRFYWNPATGKNDTRGCVANFEIAALAFPGPVWYNACVRGKSAHGQRFTYWSSIITQRFREVKKAFPVFLFSPPAFVTVQGVVELTVDR